QGHVRVVPNAALGRTAVDVVLHAVAREHPKVAVVELHRERAGELALHLSQHLAEPWLEPDELGGLVELGLRGAPLVGLDHRFQLGIHISTDDRGYSASGSQITLMPAGTRALRARSSAGRICSAGRPAGRSLRAPPPPGH